MSLKANNGLCSFNYLTHLVAKGCTILSSKQKRSGTSYTQLHYIFDARICIATMMSITLRQRKWRHCRFVKRCHVYHRPLMQPGQAPTAALPLSPSISFMQSGQARLLLSATTLSPSVSFFTLPSMYTRRAPFLFLPLAIQRGKEKPTGRHQNKTLTFDYSWIFLSFKAFLNCQ